MFVCFPLGLRVPTGNTHPADWSGAAPEVIRAPEIRINDPKASPFQVCCPLPRGFIIPPSRRIWCISFPLTLALAVGFALATRAWQTWQCQLCVHVSRGLASFKSLSCPSAPAMRKDLPRPPSSSKGADRCVGGAAPGEPTLG